MTKTWDETIDDLLLDAIDEAWHLGSEYTVKDIMQIRGEAKTAVNNAVKELTDQALPEKKTTAELNGGWRADIAQGHNEAIDQTKANINKLIGGMKDE